MCNTNQNRHWNFTSLRCLCVFFAERTGQRIFFTNRNFRPQFILQMSLTQVTCEPSVVLTSPMVLFCTSVASEGPCQNFSHSSEIQTDSAQKSRLMFVAPPPRKRLMAETTNHRPSRPQRLKLPLLGAAQVFQSALRKPRSFAVQHAPIYIPSHSDEFHMSDYCGASLVHVSSFINTIRTL